MAHNEFCGLVSPSIRSLILKSPAGKFLACFKPFWSIMPTAKYES